MEEIQNPELSGFASEVEKNAGLFLPALAGAGLLGAGAAGYGAYKGYKHFKKKQQQKKQMQRMRSGFGGPASPLMGR
jgi:hypothetical protein